MIKVDPPSKADWWGKLNSTTPEISFSILIILTFVSSFSEGVHIYPRVFFCSSHGNQTGSGSNSSGSCNNRTGSDNNNTGNGG